MIVNVACRSLFCTNLTENKNADYVHVTRLKKPHVINYKKSSSSLSITDDCIDFFEVELTFGNVDCFFNVSLFSSCSSSSSSSYSNVRFFR